MVADKMNWVQVYDPVGTVKCLTSRCYISVNSLLGPMLAIDIHNYDD